MVTMHINFRGKRVTSKQGEEDYANEKLLNIESILKVLRSPTL